MNSILIIISILFLLFIILLFYFLNKVMTVDNIIQYNVIKTPIQEEEETVDYEKVKNKYNITKCNQMCKQEVCDDYQVQKIKYDLCKECKKEMKCYDPIEGVCKYCINLNSCETLYGCNDKPPIDPLNNYCYKCWN